MKGLYQNGNFYWEKAKVTLGENREKWLCTPEKFSCYALFPTVTSVEALVSNLKKGIGAHSFCNLLPKHCLNQENSRVCCPTYIPGDFVLSTKIFGCS